jgi:signal transduction histidine kinase/ligand-binding sensor domain-containing protein/DNA-binding response OmpR family regulator
MMFPRLFFSFFIGLLLFLHPYRCKAEIQTLPFRRISPEGGFTLSPVVEIAQDKQGFIWFVTRERLYQYNSQDFISFEPKYQSGISHTNNYITSMLIDRSNAIWVGTNTGVARFNKHTWQMDAVQLTDKEMPSKILFPTDIKQNKKGEIWMIESNYLALLDSATMEMKYAKMNNVRIRANVFCFDEKEQIYAANNSGELFLIDSSTMGVTKLPVNISPIKLFGIYLINNILWVSTDGFGLRRYTREGRLIDSFFTKDDNNSASYSNRIRDVLQTSDGKIWIASYKGLIEWMEGNVNQYVSDPGDPFSLPDNSISSLMEDRQKGLWIGTWRGGVGYLNNFANTFETYVNSPFENSVSGNLINAIAENSDGSIWIGTDGQGLNVFNEQRKIFRHIGLKGADNRAVTNIKCILQNKRGEIWIGTYGGGVFRQKPGESEFQPLILENKNVYDMVEDDKGIWIATYNTGLFYYRYSDQQLIQHEITINGNVLSLSGNLRKVFLDASGNLWVISNSGLLIKPNGKSDFEQFFIDNESGKGSIQVYTITRFKDDLIWLGTDHGIFSIDGTRAIRHYPLLFNGKQVSVYGIVATGKETMWISSNFGIFSYHPTTGKTINYSASDGLHGNLFNAGAYCLTSSGKIYFGSTTGLVAFRPASMQTNPYQPEVYFTRIFINHKEIIPGPENSPLDRPLYETALLRMDPGQKSFSIEFIAQNYLNPQKNHFRYRLKGFDPAWVEAGSMTKATYTNIPPGNYVFEVVACNNDMVWNMEPAMLHIYIPRPLLLSKVAMVFYFLLLIALGILVRRILLYRTRLEHQIEMERIQRLEEEKSHQNKLNFFTNISHELRTPLTLITGPVELLMKSARLDQDDFNRLSLIRRNTGRLLKLINQLLEFRKIEENKMELNLEKTDLVSFVREIFDYFVDVAKQKNINYVFVNLQEHIPHSFDPDKIDKAVFNLLSNAFKFTPERGTIQVEISKGHKNKALTTPNTLVIGELKTNDYIQISVRDNGPGISPESIEKVFDRFYRVENQAIPHSGTGIGLHLTKYLILLHGGEIELESIPGKGSCFSIRLPYSDAQEMDFHSGGEAEPRQAIHLIHDESGDFHPTEDYDGLFENWDNQEKNHRKAEKLLLVVEDHLDLSKFICQILAEDYRIITAFTGIEGVEKARAYLPDLVISDIMMPGKTGIELLSELKNNLKTSHIPIVLLTALTSVENKIEGFTTGADDYIEKPFDAEFLRARIKNIFKSRIALQEYFSRKITLGFENEIPDTPDKKMMDKAIRFVEDNLTDEKLDIELLANHLNLSQSTLYRKLKSLTGKSATDFVRTIRLEYAARILKEGNHNIEEVSGLAGFNSHSYFTRSFKEHFGKTPTEYIAMN